MDRDEAHSLLYDRLIAGPHERWSAIADTCFEVLWPLVAALQADNAALLRLLSTAADLLGAADDDINVDVWKGDREAVLDRIEAFEDGEHPGAALLARLAALEGVADAWESLHYQECP